MPVLFASPNNAALPCCPRAFAKMSASPIVRFWKTCRKTQYGSIRETASRPEYNTSQKPAQTLICFAVRLCVVLRCHGLFGLGVFAAAIEVEKINRVQHNGRVAAIARDIGQYAAGKWE